MSHGKKRIAETSQPQGSRLFSALSKAYEISREVAADGHGFDGAQPARRFSRRTLLESVGGLAAAGAGVAILDHFTGGRLARTVGAIQGVIGTSLHPASPGNQTQASIVVTSKVLETSSSTSSSSTISSSASTGPTNKLYFYLDSNLNNKKDEGEPLLNGLYINQDKKIVDYLDGYIEIPKNSKVQLTIGGNAPNGKALTTFTSLEPAQPGLLPNIEMNSEAEDLYLGLGRRSCNFSS